MPITLVIHLLGQHFHTMTMQGKLVTSWIWMSPKVRTVQGHSLGCETTLTVWAVKPLSQFGLWNQPHSLGCETTLTVWAVKPLTVWAVTPVSVCPVKPPSQLCVSAVVPIQHQSCDNWPMSSLTLDCPQWYFLVVTHLQDLRSFQVLWNTDWMKANACLCHCTLCKETVITCWPTEQTTSWLEACICVGKCLHNHVKLKAEHLQINTFLQNSNWILQIQTACAYKTTNVGVSTYPKGKADLNQYTCNHKVILTD